MEFNELWHDLARASDLESKLETISFRRGESVYRQGDQPKGIYFVQTGLVGLVLTGAASGKEHLLRFFKQGQYFGHRALFSDEGYHGSTVVLEPTVVKLIPKSVVMTAIEKHPSLLNGIVSVLAKELRRCETQHVMILENEILIRVAQSIVYLKDLHPDHNWTRQEIANFCGSTVSTVIKALGDLEQRGCLSQEGRAIQILKRDALIALQEETF